MRLRTSNLLFFMLSCLCLLSLPSLLGGVDNWFVDIVSNFSVQYSIAALLLLIASLYKRILPLTFVAGLLFFMNVSMFSFSGSSAQASPEQRDTFTVYSANIQKTNRDFSRIVSGLKKTDADILLILEVTEESIEPLREVISAYPHHIEDLNIGESRTGAVLMSKFPILENEIIKYSQYGNMLVRAMIEINDRKVMFYGAHLPRPDFAKAYSFRSAQALSLANQISRQTVPVILAGDFNASPYSPLFKEILQTSGLKDSRKGFGWQPSWPTYLPFLWIPIDHILVSPEFRVNTRATGSHIGSDHYPVYAELSFY